MRSVIRRRAVRNTPFRLLALALTPALWAFPAAFAAAETESPAPAPDSAYEEETVSDGWLELPDSEGVTVRGKAPGGGLRANAAETLTRETIEESGSVDLGELLQRETGTLIMGTGGYGTVSTLSLGGFTGSRVAVFVDGVPVNSPQDGSFDPGDLDLSSAERVAVRRLGEIGTGLASGLPGGAVSITTAGPVDAGFRLSGGLSNRSYLSNRFPPALFTSPADTQSLRLNAEAGFSAVSVKAGGFATRALNRYGWTDASGTERVREGNDVLDGGANGALYARLSPFTSLSASLSARAADKDIPGSTVYDTPGTQRDARILEALNLETTRLGRDDLALSLSAGHTRSYLDWADATGKSKHVSDSATLRAALSWYPDPRLTAAFSAGGEYAGIDSDQNGIRSAYGGEASASLTWRPVPNAIVEPGLALASDGTGLEPVPRLGLALETDKGLRVTNNWFRLFRFPSFNDRYWSGDPRASGNPNLKSEEGYGVDFGASRSEDTWSAEGKTRITWYRDAIIWSGDSGIWRPENLGEAWYFSSSFALTWKTDETGKLNLRYDWLFTRLLTGDLAFSDGKYMPYQPVHALRAGFAKRLGGASVRIDALYSGERFVGMLNLATLPPYFLLDLSARVPVAPNVELTAGLRNAFGVSYELTEGYPMPGASLTAGVEFRLGGG